MAESSTNSKPTPTKLDPEDLEAGVNLCGDLRNMVDQDDYCDITFQCEDEKPVRASRALLMGRSSFFRTMLKTKIDSQDSEIVMDNVSSLVLLSVIEFLYTGEMIKYRPTTLKLTFETINAAILFRLPSLEIAIRRFLLRQVHIYRLTKDLSKAAVMLSGALQFRNLLERDPLLPNLVGLLSSQWTHSVYSCQLSEEAMHYLLSETKPNPQEREQKHVSGMPVACLKEYYRLRQIVFWWFYQNHTSGWTKEAADQANSAVPVVLHISEISASIQFVRPREKPPPSTGSPSSTSTATATAPRPVDLHALLTNESAKSSAMKMLSYIELRCIPPILLAEVVIPLNLFPLPEILEVCQYHLVQKPIQYHFPGWIHGAFYRSTQGSSLIQKATSGVASAVASLAVSNPCCKHTWSVSLEQLPDTFMELGFLYRESGSAGIVQDLSPRLNGARLSRHLSGSSAVLLLNFVKKTVLVNWQPTPEKNHRIWKDLEVGKDPREVSKIIFQFQLSKRCCSINLDGVDLGEIWKDLPTTGNFHPAVCFGTADTGRIHVEFGSHIE